jgi:phosphate transport system substrate-binding protein
MKKSWLAICLFIAFLGLSGSVQAQKLVIKGSNTFGEELGPRLISEFTKAHPEATIELESKGSTSGISALLAGECDIAASSRVITEDEKRMANSRGMTLKSYTIGYYGVAVIVNPSQSIDNLSDQQVNDLFVGAIKNWKEVGGPDAPVHLYIRDPVSGTYLGFQELAMQKMAYPSEAKMLPGYSDISKAVLEDPNGVGYSDLTAAKRAGVKVVSINRVQPSVDTVNEGQYPYARQLRLYTVNRKESKMATKFIRYVRSAAGQKVLEELGYVRRFEPGVINDPTSP